MAVVLHEPQCCVSPVLVSVDPAQSFPVKQARCAAVIDMTETCLVPAWADITGMPVMLINVASPLSQTIGTR